MDFPTHKAVERSNDAGVLEHNGISRDGHHLEVRGHFVALFDIHFVLVAFFGLRLDFIGFGRAYPTSSHTLAEVDGEGDTEAELDGVGLVVGEGLPAA